MQACLLGLVPQTTRSFVIVVQKADAQIVVSGQRPPWTSPILPSQISKSINGYLEVCYIDFLLTSSLILKLPRARV